MKAFVILNVLLITACAHSGAGSSGATAQSSNSVAKDDGEIVCKEERTLGSMMVNKVCRRKDSSDGSQIDAMTRRGSQGMGGGR